MELIDRINSFRDLKKGWDGYSAEPIPPLVIFKATVFVRFLGNNIKDVDVFATTNQSIQFEFEDKSYIEVEIFREKQLIYTVDEDKHSDTREGYDLKTLAEMMIQEMK